jgi:hypothetical protein
MRSAGLFGLRERLQEGSDLRLGGEAHVGVIGLVREAGGRTRFVGILSHARPRVFFTALQYTLSAKWRMKGATVLSRLSISDAINIGLCLPNM